jgi:CheY-like chemotaxis protein
MTAIVRKPLGGCGVTSLSGHLAGGSGAHPSGQGGGRHHTPGDEHEGPDELRHGAPPQRRSPRTLIADDHVPTRARVRAILEQAGFEICAEAGNAAAAVQAAVRERPDVCLLDINMPGNGTAAAAEISAQLPETAVVMLTVSAEEKDVCESLRAGATGYVLKDMDLTRIPETLRAVLAGQVALPRRFERFRSPPHDP